MSSKENLNTALLNNIHIVLCGTLTSGNIGSVARAMSNMGLVHLRLVNPRCELDEKSYWMATCGSDILTNAKTVQTLRDALSDCSYSFGTTARTRRWRDAISPGVMAQKALRLSSANKVAILFGPEDMGLSNEELELCNEVVSIPTSPESTSINLSHAVIILCYELLRALQKTPGDAFESEHAPVGMVEAMYGHMKNALLSIGFLNSQKPDHTLGMIRRLLTRTRLTVPEVNLIRGMFRQLEWYIQKSQNRIKKNKR